MVISLEKVIVGAQGISSSGKTYLTKLIRDAFVEFTTLSEEDITVIELDNFYRSIDEVYEIQGLEEDDPISMVNWDDPNLIDYERLLDAFTKLQQNGEVTIRKYNKDKGIYEGDEITIKAGKINLVESFLLFSSGLEWQDTYRSGNSWTNNLEDNEEISQVFLDLIEYKFYVECDEKVAYRRRIGRDRKMDRPIKDTHEMWHRDVLPGAEKFIYPLKDREIFDDYLKNTVLRVTQIDKIIRHIAEYASESGINIGFRPEYNLDEKRLSWIEREYEKGEIAQAEDFYDNFAKNKY